MILCKNGLSIEFASNLAVLDIANWMESLVFATTGKTPLDPAIKERSAKKNSESMAKLLAQKNEKTKAI